MRLVLLSIVVLLANGCATSSLQQEAFSHPDYDVTSFKTYAWGDAPVSVIGILAGAESIQLETRVKHAVNSVLQAKGYRLVERRNAQLLASTLIGAIAQTARSEHVVNSQRYYQAQVQWSQENEYLKGGVAIMLTHPDTNDVVWQGTAGENLKSNAGRDGDTIEKFVGLIGESLPPSQ